MYLIFIIGIRQSHIFKIHLIQIEIRNPSFITAFLKSHIFQNISVHVPNMILNRHRNTSKRLCGLHKSIILSKIKLIWIKLCLIPRNQRIWFSVWYCLRKHKSLPQYHSVILSAFGIFKNFYKHHPSNAYINYTAFLWCFPLFLIT